jgi:hypothetical protein
MSENLGPWILYIVIGLIWYYRECYIPKKRDAFNYKVWLLHKYNVEIKNCFDCFKLEQLSFKERHCNSIKGSIKLIHGAGIINKEVDIFGVEVYVFYEHQINDFRENITKRVKKIESTKKGRKEIKELIKKYNN